MSATWDYSGFYVGILSDRSSTVLIYNNYGVIVVFVKIQMNFSFLSLSLSSLFLSISAFCPLRAPAIDIHPHAKWQQNGLTVAGGNGAGDGINQLAYPWGLYFDDDQTVYVADEPSHRIMEWKWGATSGQVVAGGNGQGSGAHQLSHPTDVIVDQERDSLIICDHLNQRVVRWPRRNGTSGETIISNIDCVGLTMDENGSLYVTDYGKYEVRRYRRGESQGTVVAGGNGSGNRLDQLSYPYNVFVDRDHSVYVSDGGNHRVMKWVEGAKEGIVVAGGQGQGNGLTQLTYPSGIVVDQLGTVYVADWGNNRIMRWVKGATEGIVIVGGNSGGEQSNQLNGPFGLSFDRHGNLHVVEWGNNRVQKFNIDSNT
jgi:sugar lactone lactonase YvrE